MEAYMIQGILESGIREDGGEQCYNEIPKNNHLTYAITGLALSIFFYWKCQHTLSPARNQPKSLLKRNKLEILVALVSIIALSLTFYMRIITGKGLFILNPCHISIIAVIIMCLAPATPFMRKVHSIWTSWLFGATLAIVVPHLNGMGDWQIFLYFVEHILIVPVGPLVLYRRYGYLIPDFQNQLACFSTVGLYQFLILFPVSVLTKVNLNFALCHSPGDPLYPFFQEKYFFFGFFYLNFASFLARWFYYALTYPLKLINTSEGIKEESLDHQEPEV